VAQTLILRARGAAKRAARRTPLHPKSAGGALMSNSRGMLKPQGCNQRTSRDRSSNWKLNDFDQTGHAPDASKTHLICMAPARACWHVPPVLQLKACTSSSSSISKCLCIEPDYKTGISPVLIQKGVDTYRYFQGTIR
jgi:hypothetical protein